MELSNEIVLRPRFKFDISVHNETLLTDFEATKTQQSNFVVTRIDDHVFIRFPKNQQHYWSPQLHLEINEKDKTSSTVYGLFGPNPTIWTMFMFLHFAVASLFIAFGIWAYTNFTLDKSYAIQLFMAFLMVVFWFLLYAIGRMGKAKGTPEMYKLHEFMSVTLGRHL